MADDFRVVARVLVLVLERDGKVALQEQWDDEDLDAALARFDELAASADAAEPATPEPITNLAVETMVSAVHAVNTGGYDAVKSFMHTNLDFVNHGLIGSPGGSSQ